VHPQDEGHCHLQTVDEYITRIGYVEDEDEVDDRTGMMLYTGALQSEPETIEPCNASITSQTSANSATPLGVSSAVAQPDSVLDGGGAVNLRSSTFPVKRVS
jgi:hypothetical protein